VTNANFDIIAECDASCANTLIKLDGGVASQIQAGRKQPKTGQKQKTNPGHDPTLHGKGARFKQT